MTLQSVTPAGWRVPIVAVQIRGVQSGTPRTIKRSLIIAPSLSSGTAATDTPINIGPAEEAAEAFGVGSIAHRMVEAYRLNDPYGILHVIGTGNNGTASTGELTFGGGATEDGEISLYIAGQRVPINVADTDDATDMALAAEAAINAVDTLPLTAGTPALGVLPLTAKGGGPQGDDIDLRVNYDAQINQASGEKLPAGTTFAVSSAMSGGATPPDLSTALANLGDEPYDHIIHPWTDTTTLNAIADFLDDVTGRWHWTQQLYGHSYTASRGTAGTLNTLGDNRNRREETIWGFCDSPTPLWEWVAAHVGKMAPRFNELPTRPTKGQQIKGVLAPPKGLGRFTQQERNALYTSGISASVVSGNVVYSEQVLVTYQKLPSGAQDTAWIFAGTRHTSTEVARSVKSLVETRFDDHLLINPGEFVNANVRATNKDEVRAVVYSHYTTDLGPRGLVHNAAEFAKNLVVFRDSELNPGTGDPTKLLIGYPPDFVNPLDLVDVDLAFTQEYPATTSSGATA